MAEGKKDERARAKQRVKDDAIESMKNNGNEKKKCKNQYMKKVTKVNTRI